LEVLYFAYGSNLNKDDWAHYSSKPLEPLFTAYLPDHQVRFSYRSPVRGGGVLDLRPAIGHIVPGVMFRGGDEHWATLNRKEGPAYQRLEKICLTTDGREHRAFVYEVLDDKREPFVPPSTGYLDVVSVGLQSFKLPSAHLEAAARNEADAPLEALFSYGTLMRGECRHSFVSDAESIVPARTHGLLFDCGDYPTLRVAEGQRQVVRGELLRLPGIRERLRVLDEVEGFAGFGRDGSWFRRGLIEATTEDRRTHVAWTYLGESPVATAVIASGDWRLHQREKSEAAGEL
jgi:gamma-glutamylcyclotransferase (GGCT)/AIG2-like uncharacterized protein YtfP